MNTTFQLRAPIYDDMIAQVGTYGHLYLFLRGVAVHNVPPSEEKTLACSLVLPLIRRSGQCLAYSYAPSINCAFQESLLKEGILLLDGKRLKVNLELSDDTLCRLLVGTRARRPTLVWTLPAADAQFDNLLRLSFDPVSLVNLGAACNPSAIRMAQNITAESNDRVCILIPSNQCLRAFALFRNKALAKDLVDYVLQRVGASIHYRKMYCT